jgi:uncharacterized flavoprotein (TIGR03862 family)
MKIAVIGGGPAGLRAAEVASARGAEVHLYDAKPSVGRKLLVAGRGGLNITHGERLKDFIQRYSGPGQPVDVWPDLISAFTPQDLRAWAEGLGITTFQAGTGRVYPHEMKAAPLLRRWVERLKSQGVQFFMKHRWLDLSEVNGQVEVVFDQSRGAYERVIFALGGGSWRLTGSDGGWVEGFRRLGIKVSDLAPANCGWEREWKPETLEIAEGQPLKNIAASAGDEQARGELMVTRYGLEGGLIYRLGASLRAEEKPVLVIDFKPDFAHEALEKKMESVKRDFIGAARERLRLSEAATAILRDLYGEAGSVRELVSWVKSCAVPLSRPRPIDEAISSAGGVCWEEIDPETLALKKFPQVYVAGEMIDWEAPTGGYLMQGCFASGTRAGMAAVG